MEQIDQNKIILYKSLFRGRKDVYARFWENPFQSKSGFAPVYQLNNSRPLNTTVIASHLLGKETIGIYPLLPDNTAYFLTIDFDKQNWFHELLLVQQTAQKYGLSSYLERSKSGNGGHIWFFFEKNIPAWQTRQLGRYLLDKAGIFTHKSFDRMFPSQDEHTGKGLGNLIVLPLQGKYLEQGNTAFINQEGNIYEDQWGYLQNIVRINYEQIGQILQNAIITPVSIANKKTENISDHNEDGEIPVKTTDSPEVKLILSSQIIIPESFLPDKLYKFLREKLNFSNPQYVELQRRGYSTWKTPRWIKNIESILGRIFIPAGFFTEIQKFAKDHKLNLTIENQQVETKTVHFTTKIKLKPEQQKISKELLQHTRIILEAHPAFGKTMVGLYCMKRRKQKTLVIVHTRSLIHQWKKRIEDWSEVKIDDIGIIGENKWKIGNRITIASYQTLAKRGVTTIKNEFGFVIVDECHHVPAYTFTKVLKGLAAKYVLGLTATAYRKDQLERLMTFYLGPIIKAQSNKDSQQIQNNGIDHMVETILFTKRTQFAYKIKGENEFNDICAKLITDNVRNTQIVHDVILSLQLGGKCMVLTERIDHCDILLKLLRQNMKGVHGATISGNITKKKREQLVKRIRQDRFKLLVATGKVIGEGFDWPELTHLFLTFPCSWKGKLVQYIGRVQRQYEAKEKVYVYDYVDFEVPILKIMYFKRLRTYRSLGLLKGKVKKVKESLQNAPNQLSLF